MINVVEPSIHLNKPEGTDQPVILAASQMISEFVQLLDEVKVHHNQNLLDLKTEDAESYKEKLSSLAERADALAKVNKGTKISQIFGWVSVIATGILALATFNPVMAMTFATTALFAIDSELSKHLDGYEGIVGELAQSITEALKGSNLDSSVASTLAAVISVVAITALFAVFSKGASVANQGIANSSKPLLNVSVDTMNKIANNSQVGMEGIKIVLDGVTSYHNLKFTEVDVDAKEIESFIQKLSQVINLMVENADLNSDLIESMKELI